MLRLRLSHMLEEDMVYVPDGDFWMDRYPVTNAQCRQFLAERPRGVR